MAYRLGETERESECVCERETQQIQAILGIFILKVSERRTGFVALIDKTCRHLGEREQDGEKEQQRRAAAS